MTTTKCDVVVVGAGISGLSAAYRLKKTNPALHVVVLEAKDRVGGRTVTVPMKAASGTDRWDLGGQWVGRCQPHIMALVDELRIKIYPQYLRGSKFMQLGGHRISTYKSDIPSLSILALIDLQLYIMKIDKLKQEVSVENPWNSRHAELLDSMTVDTFLRKFMWTKGAREAVESAARCVFGAETSQMSMLFYITYVSAAGNIKNLIEATEGTAQEYKLIGGAQQVSEKLAELVGKSSVHLSEPVQSIHQTDSYVEVKTSPGNMYECKRVVCTTPPCALGHMEFSPPLPPAKQELIRRMPMGAMIKVIITYRTTFWRAAGYSGEVVSNGGPAVLESCDSGPVCIVYDATSSQGNPALCAFIAAGQAVQFAAVSKADRQSCVLNQLVSYFGDEILDYLDYQEKDWSTEPFSQGGPVSSPSTGAMKYFQAGLRQPLDRVHFAGTATATEWCGYMSGAVQAGYRAAIEVLSCLSPELLTQEDRDIVQSPSRRTRKRSSLPWKKVSIGIGACALIGVLVCRRSQVMAFVKQT